MRLLAVLALLSALLASAPVLAQIDPEVVDEAIDVEFSPPPRPTEFGGVDPDNADTLDRAAPSIVIDGAELDGPRDFSDIADPQPVTLSARISDDGAFIPDGLVWRIFESRAGEDGELALIAKSEQANPTLSLPPGEYLLHLAFGRAQVSETLFVDPGPNNRTLVFEIGALQLNAMIYGDVPIPDAMLSFDIQSRGPGGSTMVAENVAPGELIHLNAGIYSISSRFGPINAVVRSELRVEPAQITEATLYHRAAQVSLKLVSEEGGEAIADVEWTIKTRDGDTIFTDIGAFPETVLAEGDYLVLAQLGENVYNREFEVRPGSPREVEILTAVY